MANRHPEDELFIRSREWRDKVRPVALAHYPLCAHCQALGRVVPTQEIDHITVPNGDPRLQRDITGNMMGLCKPHHSLKTRKQVKGKPYPIGHGNDGWPIMSNEIKG